MWNILSFGTIAFGIVALYGSIFKFNKEVHKKGVFTGASHDFASAIFDLLFELMPWWFAKIILILMSLLVIFIGVMLYVTM